MEKKVESINYYINGWYTLYADGRIQKPDGYVSDGKSWEWVGMVEKRPFGHISSIISRDEFLKHKDDLNMKYKNGNDRYLVVDRDHGTIRVWSK